MARVQIWGSLQSAVGGQAEVEVDAKTIREMLDKLAADHPGLGPQINRGVAVSVDGEIFRDSWFVPVKPESEIVLLPKLAGG